MGKDGQIVYKILDLARLAPSSHNTQPWKVSIREGETIVGYEPERQLTVGDPDRRELFISLGCFIETASWAAASIGYEMTYRYIGSGANGVAGLLFTKSGKTDDSASGAIRTRRSDRRPYRAESLKETELQFFKSLSRGTAKPIILTKNKEVTLLSELTKKATLAAMKRDEFRAELSSWVRNNWTKRPDGMPAYVQGIPGPVSLAAKTIIRKNPKVADSQAKKDSKSVARSAAVVLILISRENPKHWLDAGRLYQAICLEAARIHISTAAYSAAVMDKSATAEMIKKLSLTAQPVALLRMGYSKGVPKASPRRKLEDILA